MKKRPSHIESNIQAQFVGVLRKYHPNILFTGGFAGETLGASGLQSIIRGARRKRMGYRAGTPDLVILEPKGCYHALFLEFKGPKGKQSPEQISFEIEATKRGYAYKVVHSVQEAEDALYSYMGLY